MTEKRDYFKDLHRSVAIVALVLSFLVLLPIGLRIRDLVNGQNDREPGLHELPMAVPVLVLFAAAATGAISLLSKDPARTRRFGLVTAWLMVAFAVLLLSAGPIERALS